MYLKINYYCTTWLSLLIVYILVNFPYQDLSNKNQSFLSGLSREIGREVVNLKKKSYTQSKRYCLMITKRGQNHAQTKDIEKLCYRQGQFFGFKRTLS
jgi:hypothetical protein